MDTLSKSPARKVFLRADDFGASPGSNEAIIDAIDCRSILNVGVMAVGSSLDHCLDALIERQDEICIGMHATINSEWTTTRWGPVAPVDTVSSLVAGDDAFLKNPKESNERIRLSEMQIELEAQLAFLRKKGLELSYLDTHMGFQWIEGVDEWLADFAARESLIYTELPKWSKIRFKNTPDLRRLQTSALIEKVAAVAGDNSIWISHPAYPEPVTRSFGQAVSDRRGREAKILIDPDFQESLQNFQLLLARFDD